MKTIALILFGISMSFIWLCAVFHHLKLESPGYSVAAGVCAGLVLIVSAIFAGNIEPKK